jgi:putative SOS response-associated peptidase YedK
MCGRYRRTTAEEEIARQYHIPMPPRLDLPISYNIAPSQNILETINARVETIDTAPAYRVAFRKHRCLIPADGYYEWKRAGSGKQPYSIQREDGTLFCFAGLWERWKKPRSEDWLRTCTIVTCEANELTREIHTRMPVILPEEYFQGWLSGSMGKEILRPYPSDLMSAYPISLRVNNPVNNDADLLRAEVHPKTAGDQDD